MPEKKTNSRSSSLIGIVSDTHGVLRDDVLTAFDDVDAIIHAGDVCGQDILDELFTIAPVQAVQGNMDRYTALNYLPLFTTIEIDSINIHIIHDLQYLSIDPKAENIQIVIHGHTHKAHQEIRDGILYLNPGSAGPNATTPSVALLKIVNGEISANFVPLTTKILSKKNL